MFDTYNAGDKRSYHNHEVEVKISQAPTDASIKLYEEYLQKAKDNLLKNYTTEFNSIKCRFHIFNSPTLDYDYKIICRFNINGEDNEFSFSLFKDQLFRKTVEQVRDIFLPYFVEYLSRLFNASILTSKEIQTIKIDKWSKL
jgi:hypothetical protein